MDAKYACAFLLNVNQFRSPEYKEVDIVFLSIMLTLINAYINQLGDVACSLFLRLRMFFSSNLLGQTQCP